MSTPASARRLIGQILKDRGVVGEGQVQEALAEQRKHGGLLGQHLIALKSCTRADLAAALAEQAGLEPVDLTRVEPSPEALERIDSSTARAYGVLPITLEHSTLLVAISDPLNTAVLDDLSFTTEYSVRYIADPRDRRRLITGQDFLHRHLVLRQRAGLVRADDRGAAQRFHGGQSANDRVAVCHPGHADGEGDRHCCRQPLRDRPDRESDGRHEHVEP